MSTNLLDYHDALKSLLETHEPLPNHERVPLAELEGRVLSRDIPVQYDVPAFDNSSMDGYAVCGADCASWQVVDRIAAGAAAQLELQNGQAARIFTGAPIPPGTTAVVMQENVLLNAQDNTISLKTGPDGQETVEAGSFIRRRAEELRQGDTLLAQGTHLNAAAVGLLAGQGYTEAACVPKLRVTVFSSGNELVEPGGELKPGAIFDSNRIMLLAMLKAQGFDAVDGGILPDRLADTREALERAAADSHAVVCSGGVSVGEEDHLKNALTQVGELTQWRLFIKPGKPFTWGRIRGCRVFLLPGNPVSSFVTFQQLALPALRRMAGLGVNQAAPWRLQARANFTRTKPEARREFLRVILKGTPEGLVVDTLSKQGSAMLSAAAAANALAEIPPSATVEQGDLLTVYPTGTRF